jgi:isopropylmalate/homocitrate/citramalate synthase
MEAFAFTNLPAHARICEVGPRDGLQIEPGEVSTAQKIRYIDLLAASGLPLIEAGSFVHPKLVPQMADTAEVLAGIARPAGVRFLVLTPNLRGFERALAAGANAIAVFTAASETFAKRNINMTIDESLAVARDVLAAARGRGIWTRASISTAFGCPYEGPVPVANVVRVARALLDLGVDELSIADTIGVGTPNQVVEIVAALQPLAPLERIGLHFHDTRGTALANVLAALQCGITQFDASSGGLGGCPFAPGATGNVATEDVLYLLHGMGIATGVDLEKVRDASRYIASILGRPLASRAYTALEAQRSRPSTSSG